MKLKIITPDHIILNADTDGVFVKAVDGELGILPRHIPIMTGLDIGVVSYLTEDGEKEYVSVIGGILKKEGENVTILSENAKLGEDIDIERAQESAKRARERLEGKLDEKLSVSHFDHERARLALMRAMSRIKAFKNTYN